MISIIDYGLGNVRAFANIYKRSNIAAELVSTKEQLARSEKIILPGVGAFDHAMEKLQKSGLAEMLGEMVLIKKVPVLGICVGMQMLGNYSDEGVSPGLKWVDGEVKLFDVCKIKHATRLPHMGWNDVKSTRPNILFKGIEEDPLFYFLHSYYFVCNNKEDIIAEAEYGIQYTCALNHENIYGVQFHPEKSHKFGIQLLTNFASL